MQIRTAQPADLPVLREIERAAGMAFRSIGMAAIAEDDPLPVAEPSGPAGPRVCTGSTGGPGR